MKMEVKYSMINYVIGDATEPVGDGTKFIVHVCNDIGAWGAGFVMALSNKWPEPESSYRWWATRDLDGYHYQRFQLGEVQFVRVEYDTYVANMIAQGGVINKDNPTPIRYDALLECLTQVNEVALSIGASIHMPRIGCGLAGGKWEEVEKVINEAMPDLEVTVYDLP